MVTGLSTEAWAESLGISAEPFLPSIDGYFEPCRRSTREIAVRAIVLQGVVAVADGVDPGPVVEWFHGQGIWESVTPNEGTFFGNPSSSNKQRNAFSWHQEAEWTLLWMIGKIESLGLPTRGCDTRRLVDEIIPPLGSAIDDFLSSATIRDPGALLAEDDRTYNLWCYAHAARRNGELPADLDWNVLYERRYAFEWLDGFQAWDDVTCDA